jgi:hypothetical protein
MRAVLVGSFVLASVGALSGCALRAAPLVDHGIAPCPGGASGDLLATESLQCWFPATHGRWRLLSRESHVDALVVNIVVTRLQDADDVARQLVAQQDERFSEILLYAQAESPVAPRVRRVRWTRAAGFGVMEFAAEAHP